MGDVIYMDVAAYGVRETMQEALDAFRSLDHCSPTFPQDFISGIARCDAARKRFDKASAAAEAYLRGRDQC